MGYAPGPIQKMPSFPPKNELLDRLVNSKKFFEEIQHVYSDITLNQIFNIIEEEELRRKKQWYTEYLANLSGEEFRKHKEYAYTRYGERWAGMEKLTTEETKQMWDNEYDKRTLLRPADPANEILLRPAGCSTTPNEQLLRPVGLNNKPEFPPSRVEGSREPLKPAPSGPDPNMFLNCSWVDLPNIWPSPYDLSNVFRK